MSNIDVTTANTTLAARLAQPFVLATTAIGALLAYLVIGSASPAQSAPSPLTNLSGQYKIGSVASLSPGASFTSGWNNTPMGRSYFVEVRPGFSANGPCSVEVTRDYRTRTINGSGQPELEVHYTVKNVGSVSCGSEVWLAYTA